MATLKEQMEADIRNVFLNPAEFGEEHRIDGKTVICIPTESTQKVSDAAGGITYLDVLEIAVATADLVKRPVQGKILNYDGCPMEVLGISDEIGMLVITLRQDVAG